jgi:hypothetical protein
LTNDPLITCVWYPSGGFGHFINAILTVYGQNFCRPNNTNYKLSDTGDSHSLDLVAPKWFHDPEQYAFDFTGPERYCVLIDNGINNEGERFQQYFNTASIIRVTYDEYTWPIIAQTLIVKAMRQSLDDQLPLGDADWPVDADWARREKYFLYLRDHPLRHAWRSKHYCQNIGLDYFEDYGLLRSWFFLNGYEVADFDDLYQTWWAANAKYFEPLDVARNIKLALFNGSNIDLTEYTDLWTQAVVNYSIWQLTEVEIPANDYANWFTNTKEIVTLLQQHGVKRFDID